MIEEISGKPKEEEKNLCDQMKNRKLESEYRLVLGYVDWVTVVETESILKGSTWEFLHAECGNNFANTLTAVRDAVRTHLNMMNAQLEMNFSDEQLKDLVRPLLDSTVDNLLRELEKKEHLSSYKGRLKWYIKKKLSVQKKKETQEASAGPCTGAEAEEYLKQAIEYLVNRRLSSIRQQTIPEKIDCYQIPEEMDVTEEEKREYNNAFDSLPKFHVQKGELNSTEQLKEQIAEVHRKKLLVGLEDN